MRRTSWHLRGIYFRSRRRKLTILLWLSFLPAIAWAENPFLSARDDQPSVTRFRGTEWGDEISDPDDEDEIALSAQVTTTRLAQMSWGSIFKISFSDLRSHASQKRQIAPYYFIVTDRAIILLDDPQINEAVRRVAALETAPVCDPGEVYALSEGSQTHEDGLWKTTVETSGDICTFQANHPSGHFTRLVWKKGVGLIEISAGRGALADGYRLKREPISRVR
jgi:hypothetical protein